MRLFVAIFLPEEVVKKVEESKEMLKNFPMRAKFVEKENLHISLSFLGNRENVEEIKTMLNEYLKKWKPFKAFINGLKFIPSEKYFRVIAFDVKSREIEIIGREISQMLKGDFKSAHLTLCRVKEVYDKKSIIERAKTIKLDEEIVVDKVELVESKLTRSGPIYSTLETFFL